MPLVLLECAHCEHRWDAIAGKVIAESEADACPACGGPPIDRTLETHSAGYQLKGDELIDVDRMRREDPHQYAHHMRAKRYYESRAQDCLDGSFSFTDKGPKELRPSLPDELQKRYY